jgi:hypothetical protein
MAIVIFDPAAFKLAFPEFATVTDARLQMLFDLAACTLLDNAANDPCMSLCQRTNLFNLLVAHLLALFGTGAAGASTDNGAPVGRLSSATEGSVSSSFEYNIPSGSAMAPWYLQTQYGALFWTATAPFRSARYYANGQSGIGRALAYGQPFYNVPGGVVWP